MGAGKFKGPGGSKSGVNNRNRDLTGPIQQTLFEEESNVMHHLTPSSTTNKFSDTKTWPTKLEEGKQGKHIDGHPNFQPGKSKLSVSMIEASNLTNTFSGTGAVVGDPASSNKERVNFGQNIGMYNDPILGYVPTSNGIIHHSSKGTHIVPAKPN